MGNLNHENNLESSLIALVSVVLGVSIANFLDGPTIKQKIDEQVELSAEFADVSKAQHCNALVEFSENLNNFYKSQKNTDLAKPSSRHTIDFLDCMAVLK